MADIDHSHASEGSVEADGVSYRGIVWFVIIMAITVVGSQALMAGTFKWFAHENAMADPARPPLARPQGELPPGPNLMRLQSGEPEISDPGSLERFRKQEDEILNGYALDPATGAARIPIDRAKALLLQRGLPSRQAAAPAASNASGQTKK